MTSAEKTAKMIRVMTVPPVLVIALILILSYTNESIFHGYADRFVAAFFLGIIPLLAYPLQQILPFWKEDSREGQRRLAFLLSIVGYVAAVIEGLLSGAGKELQFIYNTYFISVVLLAILNKMMKLRASGHACSVTGPLVFLIYFVGWIVIIPCLLVYGGSIWASIKLKRHTKKDLFMGTAVCLLSFLCAYELFM